MSRAVGKARPPAVVPRTVYETNAQLRAEVARLETESKARNDDRRRLAGLLAVLALKRGGAITITSDDRDALSPNGGLAIRHNPRDGSITLSTNAEGLHDYP